MTLLKKTWNLENKETQKTENNLSAPVCSSRANQGTATHINHSFFSASHWQIDEGY